MITQQSVLVQLIRLVERIPSPPPPRRRRARAHRLLGEALLEGSGNHDRKEAA